MYCQNCDVFTSDDICTTCWQKTDHIDYSNPHQCERFIMHGMNPAQYKPAIRAFRENLKSGLSAEISAELAIKSQIEMLTNS